MNSSITTFDYTFALSSTFVCGLFCQIPFYIKSFISQDTLSMMLMFGGGNFLSLAISQMIPETQRGFDEVFDSEGTGMPWGGISIIIGQTFIVMMDLSMHKYEEQAQVYAETLEREEKIKMDNLNLENLEVNQKSVDIKTENNKNDDNNSSNNFKPLEQVPETLDSEGNEINIEESTEENIQTPLILTCSLILHVMMECMVVGIQTKRENMWALVMAILAHKVVESMVVGLSQLKQKWESWFAYLLLFVYSCAAPFGIFLGRMIRDSAHPVVNLFFLGFASGSFLFVGINEILVKEIEKKVKMSSIISQLLGIISIIAIFQFTGSYVENR